MVKTTHRLGDIMNFDSAQILQTVTDYAVPALMALLVFFIGRAISRKAGDAAERAFNRSPKADPTLSRFFASLIRYALLLATIFIALGVLGVDTSGFGAMVAGFGVAMAFILKDSLSDVAAGVMIVLMRPYKVGDEIVTQGQTGKVLEVGLLATKLATPDDVAIIVGNSKIWGGVIRNNSAYGNRRLDRRFHIGFDTDIDQAIKVITDAAAGLELVHKSPAPWAKVVNICESSVELELRVWCDSSDYRTLWASLSHPIKDALESHGIAIPYPVEVKLKRGRAGTIRRKTVRRKPANS